MTLVELGRVTRPHGIRGEVRVHLHWADSETLEQVREVTLMRGQESAGVRRVEAARRADKAVLLRLEGVRDRDAAEALRGLTVCVPRDVLPPPEDGEYYLCDLIGATVRAPSGTIGEVTEVRVHPSVDTLVIRAPDGKLFEQVIAEPWIVHVDPEKKVIELASEEGLIEPDAMRVNVVTLFPELFGVFAETSFVKRAIVTEKLALRLEPLREHGLGKHRSVDDTPYGGGAGMVLRVDCVAAAVEAAEASSRTHRVLLTPQGTRFVQPMAKELVARDAVTLICGRYEGFDERVRGLVDEEISLGDFVLAGGEVAAMAIIEACIRLMPGVLGNEDSASFESFSDENAGLLEYPQYTRPAIFRGEGVPEVLTSGDHARVDEWRRKAALEKTLARRPELVRDKGR